MDSVKEHGYIVFVVDSFESSSNYSNFHLSLLNCFLTNISREIHFIGCIGYVATKFSQNDSNILPIFIFQNTKIITV